MPADGRFDGHVVQGHVDAVATVSTIESIDEDWFSSSTSPRGTTATSSRRVDHARWNQSDRRRPRYRERRVTVAIIPTTYELTTLSEKAPGDPVHLEVDVLAKYVERLLEARFE